MGAAVAEDEGEEGDGEDETGFCSSGLSICESFGLDDSLPNDWLSGAYSSFR